MKKWKMPWLFWVLVGALISESANPLIRMLAHNNPQTVRTVNLWIAVVATVCLILAFLIILSKEMGWIGRRRRQK